MIISTIYVLRTRSPLNLGCYTAASIVGGVIYEWIFDSRFYALFHVLDDAQPYVMLSIWAAVFGGLLVWLLESHELLAKRLGERGLWGFLAVVLGVGGTTAFEVFNTSVAGVYRYHQDEKYLFCGMPYSNMWFAAMSIVAPYWSMRKAQVLVKLLMRTNESEGSKRRIAFCLGLSCVITPWLLAAALNFVWYTWTEPWTETHETF
jgi:hypothetical protein